MRHATFAALPLDKRAGLIAAGDFPWPFEVLSVESSATHTYAAIAIRNGAFGFVGECGSLLVCPQNVGIIAGEKLRTPTTTGRVHFENGNYRMSADEAREDAARRAHR
jgi:hypothetical protein